MKSLPLVAVLAVFTTSVYALPEYDPFADATGSGGTTYTVGTKLTGQINADGKLWAPAGPTAGIAPTIFAGNLTVPGLQSSQGNSVRMQAGSGQTARLNLGTSFQGAGSSLYYSMAFKVGSVGGLGTAGAFFAGFNNTSPTSTTTTPTVVGARLYVKPAGSGGFNVGISKASGTASHWVFDSTIFNPGETIFVVARYTYGTLETLTDDSAELWINPNMSTFGAGTAPAFTLQAIAGNDFQQGSAPVVSAPIQSFVLMQRAVGSQPDETFVDELRIGQTWASVTPVPEPGTMTLLGLGLLAFINAVRKRP